MVPRKVILNIFMDLQVRFPSCLDRWYPIDFWKRLIYHTYDVGNGLDITCRQIARHIQHLGPIELSVDEGNETGFHLRRVLMRTGIHTQNKLFLQISTIRELDPLVPIEPKVWEELDTVAQLIVVERMTLSFEERSRDQYLGKVDADILKLRKKIPPILPL